MAKIKLLLIVIFLILTGTPIAEEQEVPKILEVCEVQEDEEAKKYTEQELEILAIIIYQEAGGDSCSDETRMMVGNVFLNRVNSPLFPNTFEEVALGKSQYGNLWKTGIKWPDRAEKEVEKNAVLRAYKIAERLLEGETVLPSNVIWQAQFRQGDGVYCYQDKMYFCYTEGGEA